MGLETATFISDLNPANPAHNDTLNLDDSHARLIKSTIKNTFPNFTAAALNSTQAQIDASVAATANGIAVLNDAGAFYKTNTTDGFTNPVAGEVDIKTAGVVRAQFSAAGINGTHLGIGTMPIGGTMMWFEDTLPPAAYGDYAWLNGQVIASANTRCPALLARWTNSFGGNGTTTMGVPDTREAAPYGKSTMGGTSTPGRITNYVLTTLAAFIGTCLETLSLGQIPAHNHTATSTDAGHTHGYTYNSTASSGAAGGGNLLTQSVGGTTAVGTAVITTTIGSNGGGGSHNNVSPGFVCNWVVRLA